MKVRRPPAEVRQIELEERRRARAHRRLRWEARWRKGLWIGLALLVLVILAYLARLAGLPMGS